MTDARTSPDQSAILRAERAAPPVDPTANVLQLVQAGLKAEADLRKAGDKLARKLRKQESRWRDKLADAESARIDAVNLAESRRVNSLLEANTSNVALALEKQGSQTQGQDRRIAVLEQNQYQSGGRDIQRTEGRAHNQWTIERVMALAVIGLGALYFILDRTLA